VSCKSTSYNACYGGEIFSLLAMFCVVVLNVSCLTDVMEEVSPCHIDVVFCCARC